MADNSTIDRKSTGYFANNGMMHIGDHVLYEDGYLTFRTQIIEKEGVHGFFLDNEFHSLDEFVAALSADDVSIRNCAEIDFTIIEPDTEYESAKALSEEIKLPDCPICGKSAQLAVGVDPAGFYVECSSGCTAPRCYHLDYHETTAAWADFVYFFESFFEGYREYIPLTHHDLVMSSGEKILISHEELGTWEDTSQGIYTFMDIDDLMLSGNQNLDMAQLGRTWLAFRRLSQSEIDERKRPVNLFSKRRALKHCIETLKQLRDHKPITFDNDPQLWDVLQVLESTMHETDELLDGLLWG